MLATGREIAAKIAHRSPGADAATRTVRVEIDVQDAERAIPVSTTAEVFIKVVWQKRISRTIHPCQYTRGARGPSAGSNHIRSKSLTRLSIVYVWLQWGTDLNAAQALVLLQVAFAMSSVPKTLGVLPPFVVQYDPLVAPILQIAIHGGVLPPFEKRRNLTRPLGARLGRLAGPAA